MSDFEMTPEELAEEMAYDLYVEELGTHPLRERRTVKAIEERFAAVGVSVFPANTGGGCMVLSIVLSTDDHGNEMDYILISDADAQLPNVHEGLYVGRYTYSPDGQSDEMDRTVYTAETTRDLDALVSAVVEEMTR